MTRRVEFIVKERGSINPEAFWTEIGVAAELEFEYNKYTYKWECNDGNGRNGEGDTYLKAVLDYLEKRLGEI